MFANTVVRPSRISATIAAASEDDRWEVADRKLERLRAILRKPRTRDRTCDCEHCRLIQGQPFQCGFCGYVGRPATSACDCGRQVRGKIQHIQATLAAFNAGLAWPAEWRTSPDDMKFALKEIRKFVHLGKCTGLGEGMPKTATPLFGFKGNCCHTSPFCPVCDDCGDGATVDIENMAAVLRELNALL
jgi:hypothetical protein